MKDVLHVEPSKTYDGMTVTADGTDWNPAVVAARINGGQEHGNSWGNGSVFKRKARVEWAEIP